MISIGTSILIKLISCLCLLGGGRKRFFKKKYHFFFLCLRSYLPPLPNTMALRAGTKLFGNKGKNASSNSDSNNNGGPLDISLGSIENFSFSPPNTNTGARSLTQNLPFGGGGIIGSGPFSFNNGISEVNSSSSSSSSGGGNFSANLYNSPSTPASGSADASAPARGNSQVPLLMRTKSMVGDPTTNMALGNSSGSHKEDASCTAFKNLFKSLTLEVDFSSVWPRIVAVSKNHEQGTYFSRAHFFVRLFQMTTSFIASLGVARDELFEGKQTNETTEKGKKLLGDIFKK